MARDNEIDASDQDLHAPRERFSVLLASIVPMVVLCALTVSSNGAVLAMFWHRRGLRRVKNVFFASLALADFLVGLTMPYKMVHDLHQSWSNGWACRVYQTTRHFLAYVSFLSIFMMTLDKWRTTHYPLSRRSTSMQVTSIVGVVGTWVSSFVIFSAPQVYYAAAPSLYGEKFSEQAGDKHETNSNNPSDNTGYNSEGKRSSLGHSLQATTVDGIGFCPAPYQFSFELFAFASVILFMLPLLIMLYFDVSLYLKIKWRKKVEVQRSTSVTDTYFMTLKRTPLEPPQTCVSMCTEKDGAAEALLKFSSACKPFNKHLAIEGRGERRHSSLPSISPLIGRTSSGRRVSMPETNDSETGCRYVGRKWSGSSSTLANNQQPGLPPLRMPNDGIVHDILVKQDKKTVNCLCLLLAVLLICWLPNAVVGLMQARCWCVPRPALTVASWFVLVSHSVNPFVYGWMNIQFKNVLKQWLLWEHGFRRRGTISSIKQSEPNNINNRKKSSVTSTYSTHRPRKMTIDAGMQCSGTDFSRV